MVTKFGGQILVTKFGFVPDCLLVCTKMLTLSATWRIYLDQNKVAQAANLWWFFSNALTLGVSQKTPQVPELHFRGRQDWLLS